MWWACSTVAIGLLLSGWWLVPFGLEHSYPSSMGYTNVEGWAQYFREADAWALVLAGVGVLTAVVTRSRFGITVTLLGIASAVATAVDPQGSLYNVRLLPLWFISVYLMAAWAFGTWCVIAATAWRGVQDRRWAVGTRAAPWDEADVSDRRPCGASQPGGRRRRPRRSQHSPPPPRRWGPAAVSGAILGLLAVMVAVVPPFILPASLLPVTARAQPGN